MSAALTGLRGPRPRGHQTQKPRVARGNGSSRTKLWARQVRGWLWGCGSLRPPASAGYCSASEQDSGENHRDSFLVAAGIRPPCKPMSSTTPVPERGRSEPRYFIKTDGPKVAVEFRGRWARRIVPTHAPGISPSRPDSPGQRSLSQAQPDSPDDTHKTIKWKQSEEFELLMRI